MDSGSCTEELKRSAGDPGPVLARRLSDTEYNYTIRDLTGSDLSLPGISSGSSESRRVRQLWRIADDVSGAAEQIPASRAGRRRHAFSSPRTDLILRRCRCWWRRIATSHMHPADCEFPYYRQPTDYADYFQRRMELQSRTASGKSKTTLAESRQTRRSARNICRRYGVCWRNLPRRQRKTWVRSPSLQVYVEGVAGAEGNHRGCSRNDGRRRCAISWSALRQDTAEAVC